MDLPTEMPAMTPEQVNDTWTRWQTAKKQLAEIKPNEIQCRILLTQHYFGKTPEEGTTRASLGYGYDVVLTQGVNRTIDEPTLDSLQAKMRKMKIDVAALFPYKPALSLDEYRKLTDEQRLLVDTIFTSSPAMPKLELKPTAIAEVALPPPPPPSAAIPPPPPPKLVLTDKATTQRLTFEAFYNEGWNDEQMIAQGWARLIPADTLEAQEAQTAGTVKPKGKGKRGRPAGAKNKK